MTDRAGTIDWKALDQHKFDRIVEVVLRRKWEKAGSTVTVPDGRGGDDGIDIDVHHLDGHRSTYQLKFFPDGFSGNLKSTRQRQIAKSFITAMRLDDPPTEWLLVVPTNLTTGERKFVTKLSTHKTLIDESLTPPTITIIGLTELDDMIIDDPGVYRYFARDRLRDDVDAYRLERDTLTGGIEHLHQRVANLGSLADSTDLNWGFDFARAGDTTTITVTPLHPSAADVAPITTTMDLAFGPEDSAIRDQFERTHRFGASARVTLPPEVVRSLTVDGPELIRGAHENVQVVLEALGSKVAVGKPLVLQFYDQDDKLQASHKGTITFADHGTDGYALKAGFYGHLTAEFLVPLDIKQKGRTDISYTLSAIEPADAVGVLGLLQLLQLDNAVCKVLVNGDRLMSFAIDPHPDRNNQDELDVLYNSAYDLHIVQDYLQTSFHLPDELSVRDRIHLRVARILIEGYVVQTILAPGLRATMAGTDSSEIRTGLTEPTRIQVPLPYIFPLGDRIIDLGTVTIFHNEVRATNSAEALRALDAGNANGFEVQLEPNDSPYFNAYIPERLNDPDQPMIAEWSLPDITQPGTNTAGASGEPA